MAVASKLDVDHVSAALGRWLAGKLSVEEVLVSNLEIPKSSGFSAETVLFDADWREDGIDSHQRLVARVEPSGIGLFPDYNVQNEARVIAAVAATGKAAVPHVIGSERDPSVLGAPFFVMERIAGRVPADDPPFTAAGWVLDLDPAGRSALYQSTIEAIVGIQDVDVHEQHLSFLDHPERGSRPIDQHLSYWESYYTWASGGACAHPTINATIAWIRANLPDGEDVVLSWGDARPGNIIFDEDLSCAAVLDWEMTALASPEMDLGFLAYTTRFFTDGLGLDAPEGFPDSAELVISYERLSGRSVSNMAFYEVFAGLRSMLLLMRVAALMIEHGHLPGDSTMALNNPAVAVVTDLLSLPRPRAGYEAWAGRRDTV